MKRLIGKYIGGDHKFENRVGRRLSHYKNCAHYRDMVKSTIQGVKYYYYGMLTQKELFDMIDRFDEEALT